MDSVLRLLLGIPVMAVFVIAVLTTPLVYVAVLRKDPTAFNRLVKLLRALRGPR